MNRTKPSFVYHKHALCAVCVRASHFVFYAIATFAIGIVVYAILLEPYGTNYTLKIEIEVNKNIFNRLYHFDCTAKRL